MRVWTIKDFDGHYPVGTAAVIVADNPHQAAFLLEAAMQATIPGFKSPGPDSFKPLSTARPICIVLADGNY